jgi:hypothetical protein
VLLHDLLRGLYFQSIEEYPVHKFKKVWRMDPVTMAVPDKEEMFDIMDDSPDHGLVSAIV